METADAAAMTAVKVPVIKNTTFHLKNIEKIENIPTLIVHNRLDMCCPLKGAWDLYRSLNNAEIEIIADLGHVGKKLRTAFRKHF